MKTNRLPFKFLAVMFLSFSIMACSSSREVTVEETQRLKQLVNEKHFEFDLQFARPLATNSLNKLANSGLFIPGDNASQINLQGFNAIFKFEGDTVTADLPYFGERQFGGGYNSNTGITFEGVPKDLKITKDEKRHRYEMNFNISEDSENFQVALTLYSNLTGFININTSHRFPIRYDGKVKLIDASEEK